MILRALLSGLSSALFAAGAHAANDSLETVEVTASREQMRREIQTFVHKVTRLEGEFVGRWGVFVCPMAVGVSDAQAQFIQRRIIEVQNTVRKKQPKPDAECRPNLFVISVVSLAQIDLSADLGGIDSILRLFAQPRPEVPPAGLTEWDYAFLNGLYRASYSPMNQQRDIEARMVRELAPR
jgi:hypothetical protein